MLNAIYTPDQLQETTYRCQYLVIGSGAGGSVAAMELAEAGKDVIILEEGGNFDTADFSSQISDMTRALYRKGGVTPFWGAPPIGFTEGCCVGGGTVINGGLLWRTPERMLDLWQKQFGLAGYSMQDLTPHFKKIEDLLKVGYHVEDDDNRDSDLMAAASNGLGWKQVPVPRVGGADCKNSNYCPTGCPTGAKLSTALTYLPRAIDAGARIFTRCKAFRIKHSGRKGSAVLARVPDPSHRLPYKTIRIIPDYIILAAGAVQTPFLLRRSGLSRQAGRSLQFHYNLKFVATFNQPVQAQKGTIFTVQVQEFMDDGLLIMPSNYRPQYVAMTLAHFGNEIVNEVMEKYDQSGLYVAQVQARSVGQVTSLFRSDPFVNYRFDPTDLPAIKNAFSKIVTLLFQAGAKIVYLPLVGSKPIRNVAELTPVLDHLDHRLLELVSVHAMSSCPMGAGDGAVVDFDGKLRGFDNILVTDASVLPTNIGESPQGTIMAFAHRITETHLAIN